MSGRSEFAAIQRAVGEVLIPEAREAQKNLPPMDDSLPIALELYYVAFAMKRTYQRGAVFMADHYARRMGLDSDEVYQFALHRLNQVLPPHPSEPKGDESRG